MRLKNNDADIIIVLLINIASDCTKRVKKIDLYLISRLDVVEMGKIRNKVVIGIIILVYKG